MICAKASAFLPGKDSVIEWRVSDGPVPYGDAVAFMEARAAAIASGEAPETVWFLEHPPLYTAGTSARTADLLEARFPVHKTGRGGQFTYHGPGQRVVYVMLDLNRRKPDLRAFVCALEARIIATLCTPRAPGRRRGGRRPGPPARAPTPRAARRAA